MAHMDQPIDHHRLVVARTTHRDMYSVRCLCIEPAAVVGACFECVPLAALGKGFSQIRGDMYTVNCAACLSLREGKNKEDPTPVRLDLSTPPLCHSDAMTPTLCGAFCTSLRYSFFAVEDADWCRCGVMSRFPSGTPIRKAAWAQQPGHDINNGDLHVAVTGIPSSEAVVGETKFQCDQTCSGDKTLKGCGGNRAWDIYSVTTPCVLFRECDDFDFAGVRP